MTLTHTETAASATKNTDDLGEFQFDFLRVGSYMLTLEAASFKRYERTGINLVAGQQVRQNFVLEVGSVTETIKIEATAPLVNTASAEQSRTFEIDTVRELPLARRNFSSLLRIGTGVSSSGDSVRMNGVGKNGTAFSVDGSPASANPEGNNSSTYSQVNYVDLMSLEAIQEVQTLKGVPQAEYGHGVGGQVNLLTRSGTNRWHGSLFENFQAEDLNARFQKVAAKTPLTFNQYGGAIGGPIKRDKIFIFGAYEGYQERSFQFFQANVPTEQFRNQMVAAVPEFKLVLGITPLPNGALKNPDVGLFQGTGSASRSDNHADIKSDIRLFANSNLALSYSRGRPYRLLPSYYLNGANDRNWNTFQERGVATYVLGGARWTSESRFGYNLNNMDRTDKFFLARDPNNSKEQFEFGRRLGRVGVTDLAFTLGSAELFLLEGATWNLDQKFSRYIGKHSLKFGGDYMHQCCMRTNPENPAYSFLTKQDLLNNTPTSVTPTFGSGVFKARMFEWGLFAQDDWRVTRNFVLNLGIRYDYFSNLATTGATGCPQCGFYNPDGITFPDFKLGPIRNPTNPYNSDSGTNLAPRFGFAYDVGGAGKTVVRGGWGIMYSNQMAGAMWQSINVTPTVPFRASFSKSDVDRLGLKYPMYNDQFRAIVEDENKRTGKINLFSVFNPDLQNPYSMQYTFGIQRSLTQNLILDTAFAGTRGVKFLMQRPANTVDRVTGLRPNPLAGQFIYVDSSQQLFYNSWQTSLRKRFSSNLSGSVNYTWGKSLSTGGGDVGAYYQGDNGNRTQDFFNIRADRGPATGDVTHYFAAEWIYQMPRLSGISNALLRQIAGGWEATGIFTANSGGAFSVGQGSAVPDSRADYIGGQTILSDYRKTLQYLDTSRFAKVPVNPVSKATVRAGNIGVGALRAPGGWNLDLGLAKNFFLTERIKLQLRTDMFNAFNHTSLTGLDTNINSPRFGQLTSAGGARLIQLNGRLTW